MKPSNFNEELPFVSSTYWGVGIWLRFRMALLLLFFKGFQYNWDTGKLDIKKK